MTETTQMILRNSGWPHSHDWVLPVERAASFPSRGLSPTPACHLARPFSPCGLPLQRLDFSTWWLGPHRASGSSEASRASAPRKSLPTRCVVRASSASQASRREEQRLDKNRWEGGCSCTSHLAGFFFFPVSFFYFQLWQNIGNIKFTIKKIFTILPLFNSYWHENIHVVVHHHHPFPTPSLFFNFARQKFGPH